MADDRLTDFSVQYDLIDLTALEDATITTSSNSSFADISNMAQDAEFPNYMTWEHNHNILDGSLAHWETNTYTTNNISFFSSAKSDSVGEFDTNPKLNIRFSTFHSSIGLSIYFVSDPPLQVKITWYSTHEEIISNTYDVISNIMFINEGVKLYDEIEVEFVKAIPDRYVKLYFFMFGRSFQWDETVAKSGQLVQEINMLSDKLSLNTLTFEIIDIDNTLNFGNADNIIEYFVRNQAMYPRISINDQVLNLGKYYLDKVTTDNNIAKFNAYSAIGLLDNVPFNGGRIYTGTVANGDTAGDVIAEIFQTAGITSYSIDANTAEVLLYGTLKPCTCRQALQKIMFVTGAIARTNSDEYQIIIEQPSTSLGTKITRADKISTKVSDMEYVTGVKLTYTSYTEKSVEEKIVSDRYESGTTTIVFTKPFKPSSIRVDNNRVTVNNVGTYFITFTIASTTTFSIYGVGYDEVSNDVAVSRTSIKPGAVENIKTYSTNLCDYIRAARLTSKILNYYITSSLNIEIRNITDNNSMTGKQVVFNSIEGLSNYVGRYTSRTFDLTGGFIDNAKLIGYYASASADEYYTTTFQNKQDMYTGDYLI